MRAANGCPLFINLFISIAVTGYIGPGRIIQL